MIWLFGLGASFPARAKLKIREVCSVNSPTVLLDFLFHLLLSFLSHVWLMFIVPLFNVYVPFLYRSVFLDIHFTLPGPYLICTLKTSSKRRSQHWISAVLQLVCFIGPSDQFDSHMFPTSSPAFIGFSGSNHGQCIKWCHLRSTSHP